MHSLDGKVGRGHRDEPGVSSTSSRSSIPSPPSLFGLPRSRLSSFQMARSGGSHSSSMSSVRKIRWRWRRSEDNHLRKRRRADWCWRGRRAVIFFIIVSMADRRNATRASLAPITVPNIPKPVSFTSVKLIVLHFFLFNLIEVDQPYKMAEASARAPSSVERMKRSSHVGENLTMGAESRGKLLEAGRRPRENKRGPRGSP